MEELTPGDFHDGPHGGLMDFVPFESIASLKSLLPDTGKIQVQSRHRIELLSESNELRVMSITLRLSEKDLSGEEPFTPQGDQSDRIEVLGVKGPKPHM